MMPILVKGQISVLSDGRAALHWLLRTVVLDNILQTTITESLSPP